MTTEEAIKVLTEQLAYSDDVLPARLKEAYEVAVYSIDELKAIKGKVVFYSNRPIEDIVLEARADAIDEVVNLYEKWTKLEKPQQAYYWTVVLCKLKEIAEQLKEKKE